MRSSLVGRISRGLKKPPGVMAERVLKELRDQADRYLSRRRAVALTPQLLARRSGFADCDEWWEALSVQPYVTQSGMRRDVVEELCPGDFELILNEAERALRREVDLLGSGPVELGTPIDWLKDYKTGYRWAPAYCRDIEYSNLDSPSDVKFPWEVSRMQWLIPAGQAFVLTREERFASGVRDIVQEWIEANPYAATVNWACTMDVALRLITWTWLFHMFQGASAWSDRAFRQRFLQSLYLHGEFILRHLEKSDINGNHFTADAAGLVFAGYFFAGRGEAALWARTGWDILCRELFRQVFPDGVDFEASVPYHRLVEELFLFPALYRLKLGLEVPAGYRARLAAMARFTASYSRTDGSVPLWGDADDARTLPFRRTPINDHRYLLALAGLGLQEPSLIEFFSGPRSEPLWFFGPEATAKLPASVSPKRTPGSEAFREGGFYVLRNNLDHVFVDCGPLGTGGRGGHGHNDLLSFEAVLKGVHLISDCGAYLYTASMKERNRFRSTVYHNTPRVDREEINRFIRPDYLWSLQEDARHKVEEVSFSAERDKLRFSHSGYLRLKQPVKVRRMFELLHREHCLTVSDEFEGIGEHAVEIPLHFAPDVLPVLHRGAAAALWAGTQCFELTWEPENVWAAEIEYARVSPSYGVVRNSHRIVWRRHGLLAPLKLRLVPAEVSRGCRRCAREAERGDLER